MQIMAEKKQAVRKNANKNSNNKNQEQMMEHASKELQTLVPSIPMDDKGTVYMLTYASSVLPSPHGVFFNAQWLARDKRKGWKGALSDASKYQMHYDLCMKYHESIMEMFSKAEERDKIAVDPKLQAKRKAMNGQRAYLDTLEDALLVKYAAIHGVDADLYNLGKPESRSEMIGDIIDSMFHME